MRAAWAQAASARLTFPGRRRIATDCKKRVGESAEDRHDAGPGLFERRNEMLSDRARVTAEQVRAELEEGEQAWRRRRRTLKALLRTLEAEEPETAPKQAKKANG